MRHRYSQLFISITHGNHCTCFWTMPHVRINAAEILERDIKEHFLQKNGGREILKLMVSRQSMSVLQGMVAELSNRSRVNSHNIVQDQWQVKEKTSVSCFIRLINIVEVRHFFRKPWQRRQLFSQRPSLEICRDLFKIARDCEPAWHLPTNQNMPKTSPPSNARGLLFKGTKMLKEWFPVNLTEVHRDRVSPVCAFQLQLPCLVEPEAWWICVLKHL